MEKRFEVKNSLILTKKVKDDVMKHLKGYENTEES